MQAIKRMPRVLVACEFSGTVRDAFLRRGIYAASCDLEPSESPYGKHFQEDARRTIARERWDLVIAHPPCTFLCSSGARWWRYRKQEQEDALDFVSELLHSAKRVCIENPIGLISSRIRKPDQIIQPWQFGHGETKATCLWLVGLPEMRPTKIVEKRVPRMHTMSPSNNRSKERSRTYKGIASAMAHQWGNFLLAQMPAE